MTLAEIIALPDIARTLICETKPKVELNDQFWEGAGVPYYCDWSFFPPFEVKDESSTYTRTTSLVDCTATGSSWFHDTTNKRLYIHATDDSKPGVSGELYFATVVIPITSGKADAPVVYIPADLWDAMLYLPFLDASSVTVTQEVEDFDKGGLTLSAGSLAINNDGTAYYWFQDYIWDYADIVIKVGPKGEVYSEFITVFTGQLLNPSIDDKQLTFQLMSPLVALNEDVVATKFTTTAYTNMDPNAEGRPQPWIFGYVEGIIPVCIETLTFVYRVACHACEEIEGVWKDGVLLTLTTDYTVAADNSEFTLVADPGDAEIRCAVWGVKANQAKNLIKYSEAYGNPAWDGLTFNLVYFVKPPMTTGIADPYGGIRATQFASLDGTLNDASGIYQTFANSGVTYTIGITYTVSIWARCVSGTLLVEFGFNSTQYTLFTLTTTWQRLTYTAAYAGGVETRNIQIKEDTASNPAWQIAFPQAVQASALTRYTQTTDAVKAADTFSYYTADILAYFLSGSGPVSQAYEIDMEGLNELLIRRPEFIGWQIADEQKGMDFLSLLMRTAVFQLTPLLDGSVKPFIYKTTVDSDAFRIDGPDMLSFRKYHDTQAVRKAINVKYGYQQYLGDFKTKVVTDADAEDRYGAKDYLEIETAHIVGSFAQTAGEYFQEMYKQPPTKLELGVRASAMGLVPGDQIIVNKTVIRPRGG